MADPMPQEKTVPSQRVPCALCGSRDSKVLFQGRDRLHHTDGQWSVARCKQCGLAYTQPQPIGEAFDVIYPPAYSPHKATHPQKQNWRWRLEQWALQCHWGYPPATNSPLARIGSLPALLFLKARGRNYDLFPFHGRGRLLDYGCGNGKFLGRMKQRGWQVWGMDASEQAVDCCGQQGLDVRQGLAMDKPFDAGFFDVVTLWHVLEHVPDPSETIRQAFTVLKPGGKLVIGVPNSASPPARWFGSCWLAWDLPRHLTHFDRNTIRQFLDKGGFTVDRITSQRYGQIGQTSFRLLADETGSRWHRFLGSVSLPGHLVNWAAILSGEPEEIVVHATKPANTNPADTQQPSTAGQQS